MAKKEAHYQGIEIIFKNIGNHHRNGQKSWEHVPKNNSLFLMVRFQ